MAETLQWGYEITDIKRAPIVFWEDKSAEAKGEYLLIYISITNMGSSEETLFGRDFKLRVEGATGEIRVHEKATKMVSAQAGIEKTVTAFGGLGFEPGVAVPQMLAFDVPAKATGLQLKIKDGRRITFDLGVEDIAALTVLPTPTPTPDWDKDYALIDPRELEKSPDKYKGVRVQLAGKTFSIEESGGRTAFQMWADVPREDFSEVNIAVKFSGELPGVFKGTKVRVYGVGGGNITGRNAFGAKISVPLVDADRVVW